MGLRIYDFSGSPIYCGYDWGIRFQFPDGYFTAGDTIAVDLRRVLSSPNPDASMQISRVDGLVTARIAASITRMLIPAPYNADLILVKSSGARIPTQCRLLIPVIQLSTR